MYDPVGVRQLDPFIARAMIRLPDVRMLVPPAGQVPDPGCGPPVADETPPPRAVES